MPIQKGNKIVMTEEEAKAKLEQMGLEPPSAKKSKKGNKNQPQVDMNMNMNNIPSPQTAPKGGSGWWNEPVRHSLSRMGIQTAIQGKQPMDDLGSVYYPDESYNNGLRDLHGKIKADSLKEILKRLHKNPTMYERLDEEVQAWIQQKVGHLFMRYESQKGRQQLTNGMFKVPKDEYELLKDFENGIRDDISTINVWTEELRSNYNTKVTDYEQKLKTFAEEQHSRYKGSPERYRRAVTDKLTDYQLELSQMEANLKYAEHIKGVCDETYNKVKSLYDKATIEPTST